MYFSCVLVFASTVGALVSILQVSQITKSLLDEHFSADFFFHNKYEYIGPFIQNVLFLVFVGEYIGENKTY